MKQAHHELDQLLQQLITSSNSNCFVDYSNKHVAPQTSNLYCKSLNKTAIFHVPEDVPIDVILRHFGIDQTSLQCVGNVNYRSINHLPIELAHENPNINVYSSAPGRYTVCQEIPQHDLNRYLQNISQRQPNKPWNFHDGSIHIPERRISSQDLMHPMLKRSTSNHNNQRLPFDPSIKNAYNNNRRATINVWNRLKDFSTHDEHRNSNAILNPNVSYNRNSPYPRNDISLYNENKNNSSMANAWNRAKAATQPNNSYGEIDDGRTLPIPPVLPVPKSLTTLTNGLYRHQLLAPQ